MPKRIDEYLKRGAVQRICGEYLPMPLVGPVRIAKPEEFAGKRQSGRRLFGLASPGFVEIRKGILQQGKPFRIVEHRVPRCLGDTNGGYDLPVPLALGVPQ